MPATQDEGSTRAASPAQRSVHGHAKKAISYQFFGLERARGDTRLYLVPIFSGVMYSLQTLFGIALGPWTKLRKQVLGNQQAALFGPWKAVREERMAKNLKAAIEVNDEAAVREALKTVKDV